MQPLPTYTTSFPLSLLSHSPAVTLPFFLFLEHAKPFPWASLDTPQILPQTFHGWDFLTQVSVYTLPPLWFCHDYSKVVSLYFTGHSLTRILFQFFK